MSNSVFNINNDPEAKEIAFRKSYLFNVEEVIESINLSIEHYKFDDENNYTAGYRQSIISLFEELLLKLEKAKLPVLTELWKH